MDIFADALSDSLDSFADKHDATHVPGLALSQAGSHDTPPDVIAIDCDDLDGGDIGMAQTTTPAEFDGNQGQHQRGSQKRQKPLADEEQEPPQKLAAAEKKKKQAPVRLCPIRLEDNPDVTCVLVRRGAAEIAVPLWPQYRATWEGCDSPDAVWVVVASSEQWFKQTVDAATTKSVRCIGKNVNDFVRKEMVACITSVRNQKPEIAGSDLFTDDDLTTWKSSTYRGICSLEISIGGYSLACLNYLPKLVVKLDEKTPVFIRSWLLPLVQKLARSQGQEQEVPKETAQSVSVSSLASFQFTFDATPSIRGKIAWVPNEHAWRIFPKKAKFQTDTKFKVDPELADEEYEKEKRVKYSQAVKVWNQVDGSKRLKITLTQVSEGSN